MENKKIKTKNDLYEFLEYESKQYGLKSKKCPLLCVSENKVLYKFNNDLRKCEYYTNTDKKIMKVIYKLKLNRFKRKYSISIPINVFDKGLKLVHIGPRLVNANAKVGKNCIMHINTCIVAGGTNDDVPTLGDNIIIGVGAVISGKAKLGNDIAVGANAFVNKDFSDGYMTIGGVPAKKISDKTRNDWKKENRNPG